MSKFLIILALVAFVAAGEDVLNRKPRTLTIEWDRSRVSPVIGILLRRVINLPGIIEMIPPRVIAEIADHPKVMEALIKAASDDESGVTTEEPSFLEKLLSIGLSTTTTTSENLLNEDNFGEFDETQMAAAMADAFPDVYPKETEIPLLEEKPSQIQRIPKIESAFMENQRINDDESRGMKARGLSASDVFDALFRRQESQIDVQNIIRDTVSSFQRFVPPQLLSTRFSSFFESFHNLPSLLNLPSIIPTQSVKHTTTTTQSTSTVDSALNIGSDVVFMETNKSHGLVESNKNQGFAFDLTGSKAQGAFEDPDEDENREDDA